MKINREKLISLIDTEIERLKQLTADSYARRIKDAEREVATYVKNTSAGWEEFAQRIMTAVAAGNPVTSDLIPPTIKERGSRTYVRAFEVQVIRPGEMPPQVNELEMLKKILEASTDDEVSTYALEKQGFPLGRVLKGQ